MALTTLGQAVRKEMGDDSRPFLEKKLAAMNAKLSGMSRELKTEIDRVHKLSIAEQVYRREVAIVRKEYMRRFHASDKLNGRII